MIWTSSKPRAESNINRNIGPYARINNNLTWCPVQSRLRHTYHGQSYARVDLNPMPESGTLDLTSGFRSSLSRSVHKKRRLFNASFSSSASLPGTWHNVRAFSVTAVIRRARATASSMLSCLSMCLAVSTLQKASIKRTLSRDLEMVKTFILPYQKALPEACSLEIKVTGPRD